MYQRDIVISTENQRPIQGKHTYIRIPTKEEKKKTLLMKPKHVVHTK